MSWSYRVVKKDDAFHITEVYYGDSGEVKGWVDPANFGALHGWWDYEDLKDTAELVLGAFDKPVLEWKPGGHPDGHLVEVGA